MAGRCLSWRSCGAIHSIPRPSTPSNLKVSIPTAADPGNDRRGGSPRRISGPRRHRRPTAWRARAAAASRAKAPTRHQRARAAFARGQSTIALALRGGLVSDAPGPTCARRATTTTSVHFLLVRPALCLRLPSDLQSPATPCRSANSSPCRVRRELPSPVNAPCQAHKKKGRHKSALFYPVVLYFFV